jgi:predicted small lipoprotein YifL
MTGRKNSGKGTGMKHPIAALPILLTLLALAACGDDSDSPKFFCPAVAVLQPTGQLTEFLPASENIPDEITSASITGVAGDCASEPDKHAVKVKFQVGFTATNGPANKADKLTLPYFVAIVEGERIISKQIYSIPVSFDGNASIADATSKPLTVELPDTPRNDRTQVLVGFQLTPEQQVYATDHPHS